MATVQELERKLQLAFDRQDATKAAFDQAKQQENASFAKYQDVVKQQGTGKTLIEITSLRKQISADPNNAALQSQLAAAQASMKEKQAVIAQARIEDEIVQAAAQVTKQPYLDAFSDADEINQDLEAAKTQQTQEAKTEETAADVAKESGAKSDTVTPDEEQKLETADDPQGATTLPPAGNNPDEASAAEPANGIGSDGVYRVAIDGYPKVITPKSNPLHKYNTSTYLFSLHLLNKDTYNRLSQSRQLGSKEVKFKTDGVLIASGGNTKNRNPLWKDNFYIENVDMTTIIGLRSDTQGTNAVTLKFNIIEPRGLSLIERLINSVEGTNYASYLEMVFALQIDFIGYTDNGNIVNLPNHTKYVPIKITGITFKVSERGTEYAVSAVPYNHVAFNSTHLSAPTSLSITAATVGDYFSDRTLEGVDTNSDTTRVPVNESAAETARLAAKKVDNKYEKAASWASALNKLERFRKKADPKYIPDQYQIKFSTELANSRLSAILNDKIAEITATPMSVSENQSAAEIARLQAANTKAAAINFRNSNATVLNSVPPRPTGTAFTNALDKTNWDKRYKNTHNADGSPKIPVLAQTDAETARLLRQNSSSPTTLNGTPAITKLAEVEYEAITYSVNAGTTLIAEINKILRNSEFFIDQLSYSDVPTIKDATKEELAKLAAGKNKALRWWKIVPEVELLDFDETRNTYAKKITFFVNTYTVDTNLYPGTPKKTPQPRKVYDYLFTGKNLDILNFNLDFNTTYYVAISTDLNKNSSTSNSATQKQKDDTETKKLETGFNKTALANVQRRQQSGNNASTAGSGANRDPMSAITADIQTQLFGRPSGDLVTLDMTIIGDPDFIKQDDIFSGAVRDTSQLNGSMPMDTGEVYLRVNFNTPTDFDESTGLVLKSTQSKFSGIYRLLTIANSFQAGKFTQKLNAVRIFDDNNTGVPAAEPKKNSSAIASAQTQLKDAGAGANAEGTAGETAARNALPLININSTQVSRVAAFGANAEGTEGEAEARANAALAQVAATAPTTQIPLP